MTAANLLVELFVEELPPKALKKLGEAFAAKIFEGLELNDFLEPGSVLSSYATPRRLAVHITSVRGVSQPRPKPPKTLILSQLASMPKVSRLLRSLSAYARCTTMKSISSG